MLCPICEKNQIEKGEFVCRECLGEKPSRTATAVLVRGPSVAIPITAPIPFRHCRRCGKEIEYNEEVCTDCKIPLIQDPNEKFKAMVAKWQQEAETKLTPEERERIKQDVQAQLAQAEQQRQMERAQQAVRQVRMGCATWMVIVFTLGLGIVAALNTKSLVEFGQLFGLAIGANVLLYRGLACSFADSGFGLTWDNLIFPFRFSNEEGAKGWLFGSMGLSFALLYFSFLSERDLIGSVQLLWASSSSSNICLVMPLLFAILFAVLYYSIYLLTLGVRSNHA